MERLDYFYLAHLLACALHQTTPQPIPATVTWEKMLSLSKAHSVSATLFPIIDKVEMPAPIAKQFKEEYHRSMVKQFSFDTERTQLFSHFEEQGIRYLPLKGVILQQYYPQVGMRMFCDNDILFHPSQQKQVETVMEHMGYEATITENSHHDNYKKEPVFNFELHRKFLSEQSEHHDYWKDPWAKAQLVSGHHYRQSHEDYYLFYLCHLYKHFSRSGAGIRYLVDNYQLLHHIGPLLNHDYLAQELACLGLTDFSNQVTQLSTALFSNPSAQPQLSDELLTFFEDMMQSGTYGTQKRYFRTRYTSSGHGRVGYLLGRILPTYRYATTKFPIIAAHPALYVVGYLPLCLFRCYRFVVRRKIVKVELQSVLEHKKS